MNSSNYIPMFAYTGTTICAISSVTLFILKSLGKRKLEYGIQFFKQIPFQSAKLHMLGGVGINSIYFQASEPTVNRIYYSLLLLVFSIVPMYVLLNFMESSIPFMISIFIITVDITIDAITIIRFYRYLYQASVK